MKRPQAPLVYFYCDSCRKHHTGRLTIAKAWICSDCEQPIAIEDCKWYDSFDTVKEWAIATPPVLQLTKENKA